MALSLRDTFEDSHSGLVVVILGIFLTSQYETMESQGSEEAAVRKVGSSAKRFRRSLRALEQTSLTATIV